MPAKIRVLVPDGETSHALSAVRCLSRDPALEIVVSGSSRATSSRWSRHVERFVHRREHAGRAALEEIGRIARDLEVDLVFPVEQDLTRLLIEGWDPGWSGSTRLVGLPERWAFAVATDKARLAEWLPGTSIEHPPTILLEPVETLAERLGALVFPLLAKPARGHSGQGIRYLADRSALEEMLQTPRTEEWVLQQYIPGINVDCSMVCRDGRILAHSVQEEEARTDDHGIHGTGRIRLFDDSRVVEACRGIVAALGWSGLFHVDMRREEGTGRILLVECSARVWASVQASMLAGVNVPALVCREAAGLPLGTPQVQETLCVRLGEGLRRRWRSWVLGEGSAERFADTLSLRLGDPLPEVLRAVRRWTRS